MFYFRLAPSPDFIVIIFQPPVEDHQSNRTTKNTEMNSLFCPHDLSFHKEFRDDLPTLLNGQDNNEGLSTKLNVSDKSSLSVFDTPENSDVRYTFVVNDVNKLLTINFHPPYCRMSRRKRNWIDWRKLNSSVRTLDIWQYYRLPNNSAWKSWRSNRKRINWNDCVRKRRKIWKITWVDLPFAASHVLFLLNVLVTGCH